MGKGWQFDFSPTNPNGLQSFPNIAGNGDTLCVVWEETGFGGNAGDLLFSFSTTGAAGLAAYPPNFVGQAPGNQKYPDILFENGVFHLIYQTAGALEYRKGPLAIVNSSKEPASQTPAFSLIGNPVSGFILVKMEGAGEAHFSLLSTNGRVIEAWQEEVFSSGQVAKLRLPSAMPSGIYFLKMEKEGISWTEKLVVK